MVPAYGGLPVNTVYGRNSATVIVVVLKSVDHAAIEVGPGVDSGVEKPPNTKVRIEGTDFEVAATAVITCVSKTYGGPLKVEPGKEDIEVSIKGPVNPKKYTEITESPGSLHAAVTNWPTLDSENETEASIESRSEVGTLVVSIEAREKGG